MTTITIDRAVVEQALEALERAGEELRWQSIGQIQRELRAAIAEQQAGEPVAWFTDDHREDKSATTYSKKMAERWLEKGWPVTPLYTAPPPAKRVPLTDDEIDALELPPSGTATVRDLVRLIEAAHGIK